MTDMTILAFHLTERERMIVHLLRYYAEFRALKRACLPALIKCGANFGLTPFSAIAFASVFQLTESYIGRLVCYDFEEPELSFDEFAILRLMDNKPSGPLLDATQPEGSLCALFAARQSAVLLSVDP
jgi:hypothetical protein